MLIIVLKYVTSFGINFLQVPVSNLHVLVSAFDARCFSKCLMTFGCSFIFKSEVPNGDRTLCVHGRSCVDLWASWEVTDRGAWPFD